MAPLVLILVALGLRSLPASTQSLTAVTDQRVQTQMVSEFSAIQPGEPFWVGLDMQIQAGWHTYWQNPGDSGAPTRIEWSLPPGFEAGEIQWPYPEDFPVGPLVNFGYKDQVLLLSQITPPHEISEPKVSLQAEVEWLVCEAACIPESASLQLDLPVFYGNVLPDPEWGPQFEATRQKLPIASPWTVSTAVTDTQIVLQLEIPDLARNQVEEVRFFPAQDGLISNAAPQPWTLSAAGLEIQLERGYLPEVEELPGVVVIQEQQGEEIFTEAFEIGPDAAMRVATTPITPATATHAAPPAVGTGLPLVQILLLAFLGGLTLNLMPCVFPILSLKALSIARKAEVSPVQVRLQSLVFTAGILTSVGALGMALIGLKALGQQVGWGFQLQSPAFVLCLAYLLFAVGLSLSGMFTIGASWMGIGQNLTDQRGYRGEFFTGVLATVVATPCTAPFMATAVGAALTQPPLILMGILQMLGLGLAFPYILLALIPAAQKRLPKPGMWMETLQQLLAFPVYGTVAWLVWVLVLQTGTQGLTVASSGLILLTFCVWLFQKIQRAPLRWQRLGQIGAVLALLGTVFLTQGLPQGTSSPSTPVGTNPQIQQSNLAWQDFNPEQIAQLQRAKTPVFVNFSAAWCITCLVNDRMVFSQPAIAEAFGRHGVALFKADWTNYDAQITESLQAFGRSGVPLYVLYPGDNRDPVVLPQILTPGIVLNSLQTITASS
ncbi:MAG: thiol:disulfide interchange protein [Synechococcaceae cyanobacterium SM2_3_1]|nr:thiol:disulfide interchange protein [Synechococcaceae cyanobacterium SM2_3_1]